MAAKANLPKLVFRTGLDFCIGLVVFCGFALAMNSGTGAAAPSQFNDLLSMSANAAELTTATDASTAVSEAAQMVKSAVPVLNSSGDSVFRNTTGPSAMWMLGIVFAMLFAFNLAFFRHLRMQYARVAQRPGHGSLREPGSHRELGAQRESGAGRAHGRNQPPWRRSGRGPFGQ